MLMLMALRRCNGDVAVNQPTPPLTKYLLLCAYLSVVVSLGFYLYA